ncbi:MAG: hypothetical protein GY852_09565 [bacterium]|nr:hypothetical protein [bacterium]
MKKVFGIPMEKKKELTAILEADPYAKGSFAMMGYTLKEGNQVGGDESTIYLYISGDDDKVKGAEEKLKEVLVDVPGEMENKVITVIADEEDKAASGMGDIFG